MSKQFVMLFLLSALLLSGCSKEEPVVEEVIEVIPPLTEIAESSEFEGYTFNAIGEHCGFVVTSDSIEIHPYNDDTRHITVEKILLSELPYWETIKSGSGEDIVIQKYKDFESFTTVDGNTYGYYALGDETAFMFKTTDLPSYYVRAVFERICLQE